jgi:hypothetical protein
MCPAGRAPASTAATAATSAFTSAKAAGEGGAPKPSDSIPENSAGWFGKALDIGMVSPFGLWITRPEGADFRQSEPVAKKGLHQVEFSGSIGVAKFHDIPQFCRDTGPPPRRVLCF